MPQAETWRWPDHLGAKTEGKCELCGTPIFFEAQNVKFRKACYRCEPDIPRDEDAALVAYGQTLKRRMNWLWRLLGFK